MNNKNIPCNSKGCIDLSNNDKVDGIIISLIDDNNNVLAKYGFDKNKLSKILNINYKSTNIKADFNISPSSKYEFNSDVCQD